MTKTLIMLRPVHYNEGGLISLGVSQISSIAQQVKNMGIQPGLVLHSEHPKDAQAASIFVDWCKSAGMTAVVREDKGLNSHRFKITDILSQKEERATDTILVVSSEADIRDATSYYANFPTRLNGAHGVVMENAKNPCSERGWRIATTLWPTLAS